jgi:hypothetical protein
VTSAAAAHLQEAGAAREVGVRTRCARRSLIGPYLRQKKKKRRGGRREAESLHEPAKEQEDLYVLLILNMSQYSKINYI